MTITYNKVGATAAVATAMLASSMLVAEPAAALSIGNILNFTTADPISSDLATLTDNGDSTFTFNLGAININSGTSPVFGSPNDPLTFASLTLTKTSSIDNTSVFDLSGTTPFTWITAGLEGGRVYNLNSFTLTTTSIPKTTLETFTAEFSGFFDPPGASLPALGGLGGAGQLSGSGGAVSAGAIEVVPTPAVLPGLIGMGAAVFRKKKQEDTEDLALETAEVDA